MRLYWSPRVLYASHELSAKNALMAPLRALRTRRVPFPVPPESQLAMTKEE